MTTATCIRCQASVKTHLMVDERLCPECHKTLTDEAARMLQEDLEAAAGNFYPSYGISDEVYHADRLRS